MASDSPKLGVLRTFSQVRTKTPEKNKKGGDVTNLTAQLV